MDMHAQAFLWHAAAGRWTAINQFTSCKMCCYHPKMAYSYYTEHAPYAYAWCKDRLDLIPSEFASETLMPVCTHPSTDYLRRPIVTASVSPFHSIGNVESKNTDHRPENQIDHAATEKQNNQACGKMGG